MTLQVLPPEMLEAPKDKIETKENLYWKPSSLKDGESEEFRFWAVMKQGTPLLVGSTHPNAVMLRLVTFVLMATWLLVVILGRPTTSPEKPTGPNLIDQKIDGSFVKPRRFLAWVATSAARGRLEVLFIEQKSLRDQLTEILQEIEDYTWTEDGLANFSIKISRKGTGLETTYSILPKVRKVPDKIRKEWESQERIDLATQLF